MISSVKTDFLTGSPLALEDLDYTARGNIAPGGLR
jgi:hypothetical protein